MQIMQRWILEQNHPRRKLDTAHDDVDGGATARPVRLPIRQLGRDVLVPTQGVEVVLLVVVQRHFVAHPLPDGIRIVVDVEIERVVVDLGGTTSHAVSAGTGRAASGSTTSPTRLRYGHATSGGTPPHNGDRVSIFPARTHETASCTVIITCDFPVSRSSSTVLTCEKPADVSLPGFHAA